MDRLGPAIHPSECAFRPILPVTKGPVRGKLIPIAQPASEPLGEITKLLYSNLVERKLDVLIASLECGWSRFDSASDDCILPFSSRELIYRGMEHNDNSSIDTMRIEYGRDDYQDMTCLNNLDPEKENVLTKQIWTQHVNGMSMPKSIFLRQEPEDLDKIYSLKSHRFSDTTSFASDVKRSFRPALSALVGSDRVCDSFANDTDRMLSIKPSFDVNLHVMCPSSPSPTHDDYDDGAVGHAAYMEAMVENSARHNIIWLDPVFDPLHQLLPPRNESTLKERLLSLNEMCSARSISAILRLPGRFGETHDLSFRLLPPPTSHKLEYFSAIWKDFEESVSRECSLESLLAIYETRVDARPTRPRKICFDADIEIPTFVLNDDDSTLGRNTTINGLLDLNLPSFYEMCSSVRPTTSVTSGSSFGANQKNFVESFARVSNMITLKNLVKSSNLTSLFLPQTIVVENRLTVDKLMEPKPTSTVLLSAIRSLVRNDDQDYDARDIQLLQEQCSNYPVASWFLNERSDSTIASDDDLLIMRQMFCEEARAKSTDEGYRCLLLTGCSSKRNARGIYSYRGFLTNQIVDHQVFQRRYSTIVHMNKRQRNSTNEAFFTTMVLRVFVDAFARYKISKSNGRSAPFSVKLKTQRHGQLQLVVSRANEKKLSSDMIGFTANIDRIDELSLMHTLEEDTADSDEVCHAVEALGKSSLKIRGELLHLLTKARELDDEKKTYLADTVVNRSFGDADAGFDTVQTIAVDLTVPDDHHRVKKRKSGSDPSLLDEQDEKKKSKKKRKKDKKKKEKKKRKKEERKRKRQDDSALEEESISCKANIRITPREEEQQQQSQQLSTMTSNKNVTRVAVPSVPIGMTPIVRTKKLESLKKLPESQSEHLGQSVKEGTVYRPASSVETSPDSVADYHNDLTQLHHPNLADTGTDRNNVMNTLHNHDVDKPRDSNMPTNNCTEAEQLMDTDMDHHLGEEELYNECNDSSNSSIDSLTDAPCHALLSQMHLLTSESFLETFSEVVAELASGRWMNTLTESEKKNSGILVSSATARGGAEIVVLDCPLLDITGVDIELSDDSAIIVQCISTWAARGTSNNNPPNGRAVTTASAQQQQQQQGARAFIRRLVLLAASGRYSTIHVILCIDVEMSSLLTNEIVTLQNAMIMQSGCPAEHVTFEYVGPRTLSASIAVRLISSCASSTDSSDCLNDIANDYVVQESVRFLITLIPTMTVHMAIRCMSKANNSLFALFHLAMNTPRDIFSTKMDGILSKYSSDQLWTALNVDISHAY